ncbi:MAG: murein biosynthesis integral membrane protein MurJ [Bryobacteraceae bacterium]
MVTPTQPKPLSNEQSTIARSAGIVSIAVFMSRITGLIRERVMLGMFGAGLANDAFQLAFRIPNLTRDLFAEGALSSAFVPVFTEYLTTKNRKEAAVLANLVATALIVVVGTLCVLGVVFSPQLVNIFGSGYQQVPEKFALTIQMTRITFPFLLLVALAAQAMGVLNACGVFGVPAMASTFFNIGSLVFGLVIGKWAGPYLGIQPIVGMAYGVVLGGALQLFWQIPSLYRAGFTFRPQFDWSHPGLQRILRMMGPAILGSAAVQINVTVNSNFATSIVDPHTGLNGPLSWLLCAFRFMQLPLGLFGVAIASATLPSISRSAASNDIDEFRRTMARSLGMVLLLTVPSSVGLAVLGESIVGAIYQTGKFQLYDTQQTAAALSCYAIGLAGYSAVKVLAPAFYALKDSRTPMMVSLVSIAVNYFAVVALLRFTHLGHAGLALSTSVVAIINALVLFGMLRTRIGGIHGRILFESIAKISIASLAMGVTVWASSTAMRNWLGVSAKARLADLTVSIPIGLVMLYAACRLLRVSELELAMKSLAGPLQRRLPFLRDKI